MLVGYAKKIVIPAKLVGEKVVLEVDVLGKYSETALAALIPAIRGFGSKVESLERERLQLNSENQSLHRRLVYQV
jgi:hypothetical protein